MHHMAVPVRLGRLVVVGAHFDPSTAGSRNCATTCELTNSRAYQNDQSVCDEHTGAFTFLQQRHGISFSPNSAALRTDARLAMLTYLSAQTDYNSSLTYGPDQHAASFTYRPCGRGRNHASLVRYSQSLVAIDCTGSVSSYGHALFPLEGTILYQRWDLT